MREVNMSDEMEKFVGLVRSKRFLYDFYDEEYKNLQTKANTWEEIAHVMGREDGGYWSAKWKGLRDCYNRFKKTELKCQRLNKKCKKWAWAELMEFMDEFPSKKATLTTTTFSKASITQDVKHSARSSQDPLDVGEYKQDSESPYIKLECEEDSYTTESLHSEKSVHTEKSVNTEISARACGPVRPKRRQIRKRNVSQETIAVLDYIKKKNEILLNKSRFDEVDLFFLSYAQNFKRLPKKKQALLKMQIAILFTRFELQSENSDTENMTELAEAVKTISKY